MNFSKSESYLFHQAQGPPFFRSPRPLLQYIWAISYIYALSPPFIRCGHAMLFWRYPFNMTPGVYFLESSGNWFSLCWQNSYSEWPCFDLKLRHLSYNKSNVKLVNTMILRYLKMKVKPTPKMSQYVKQCTVCSTYQCNFLVAAVVIARPKYSLMRASVLVPVGIHQRLLLRGGNDLSAGGNCLIVMNCITWRTIIRSFSTSNLWCKINLY
jgi:hypothetical protein